MTSVNTILSEDFVGRQLCRDLVNRLGAVLLPSKTVLRREHLELIKHYYTLTEADLIPLEKSSGTIVLEKAIENAAYHVSHIFESARNGIHVPLVNVVENIVPSIQNLAEHPNLFEMFSCLHIKDQYTLSHSIGVSVIATLIGKWFGLDPYNLTQLTVAATLHDIGKMKIPDEILNKPERLTGEEYEIIKKHTIYGYEMVKNVPDFSHRQALVVLQHHEREDGTGYPYGIKRDEIDLFSKIVAVADVFHAMTSKRVYKQASPFYFILKQLQQDGFGKMDPTITNIFLNKIMSVFVGNDIILNDGRKGRIVMINTQNPSSPVVQVDNEFIDLSKNQSLYIDQVI